MWMPCRTEIWQTYHRPITPTISALLGEFAMGRDDCAGVGLCSSAARRGVYADGVQILGNSDFHLRENPFFQDGLRRDIWPRAAETTIRGLSERASSERRRRRRRPDSSTPLLFDEHTAAGQQLHQPGDDLVQQRLQLLVGGGIGLHEYRPAIGAPVHAVQHQAVQVYVEIGRRPKSQDQRNRAAGGFVGLEAGLPASPP